MLDVHPPHHASQSWRDFLVHIATIVVGLLIAIGLEQSVEWLHNRHLLHRTEANLHAEMLRNKALVMHDQALLDKGQQQIERNLRIESAALEKRDDSGGSMEQNWDWDGPRSAAWDAARSNGALALLPYDDAEIWALVYGQQTVVDAQTTIYIRDIYKVYAPFTNGRKLTDLTPEELRNVMSDERQLMADLRLLRDLCRSLMQVYADAETSLQY